MDFGKFKWIWLIALPLSIGLLWLGFRNERDPNWDETKALLSKNIVSLDLAVDSLQHLYDDFHNVRSQDDSLAFKRISNPYLPTMEFAKFEDFFRIITERRTLIVAGVTGTGNSTLVDRIANLIATTDAHKMQILCAPQFDLELNKRYIGHFDNDAFRKGDLLQFWDKCRDNPKEKFVCVIDNFDKINPETFFGPELWQRLDDPKFNVVLGKDTVQIPDNFYLLCITHAGVGQKIELNNEHFKRFGGQIMLPPTNTELVLYLKTKKKEVEADLIKKKQALELTHSVTENTPQYDKLKKEVAKLEAQQKALSDTAGLVGFVYFFTKANDFLAKKYSSGHQLGQWSDVRKNFLPSDFDKLQSIFVDHVNAFKPQPELKKADFENIVYTIQHDGEIPNSSPIWRAVDTLADMGFASELGVAGSFALISGIFGWLYFRRRQRYIEQFTQRVYDLMLDFDKQRVNYDGVSDNLKQIKRDLDDLVMKQKINYNEASFFYSFLEDKARSVEVAREVNESFLKLVDAFLEDNILTESEYQKLNQFLESIKPKIAAPQYLSYKNDIERMYKEFGSRLVE